jgi:mono/diheme cytochrome c family protein
MKVIFAAMATLLWACSGGAAQEMSYGQTEYLNSCAICHGTTGTGEGALADQLLKHPADLTRLSERNGGEFPYWLVYATIDGRHAANQRDYRDMPIFGDRFLKRDVKKYGPKGGEAITTERMHQLAEYVQSLQRQ